MEILPCRLKDLKEEQIQQIVSFIYGTDPLLADLLFGNKNNSLKIIHKLLQQKNNAFSYENILLSFDSEKNITGLIMFYPICRQSTFIPLTHLLTPLNYIFFKIFRIRTLKKLIIPQYLMSSQDFYFCNLYVAATYRNKGIGKQLLEAAIDQAERAKANKIYLEVNNSKVEAINLYKTVGFEILEIKKANTSKGFAEVVHMVKNIC
jgi:ribosomal protein S18 acetylase RimI-like enzyme